MKIAFSLGCHKVPRSVCEPHAVPHCKKVPHETCHKVRQLSLGKKVKMHWRWARRSARTSPSKSASMCPSQSATTCPRRSVAMCRRSSASWFPLRTAMQCRNNTAWMFPRKSATWCQESSVTKCRSSIARLWFDLTARKSPMKSAIRSQARSAAVSQVELNDVLFNK